MPGMMTPTLDVDELDKRISDLKAVEHWLKMNLNALQMTTQGLEMQRATLAAVKAMSEHAREASERRPADQPPAAGENPFAAATAMWPWSLMNAQASAAGDDHQASDQSPSEKADRDTDKQADADKPRAKTTRKPAGKSGAA